MNICPPIYGSLNYFESYDVHKSIITYLTHNNFIFINETPHFFISKTDCKSKFMKS